ncbi:nucleoside phosphatase family-domain-containing protein [Auriculariales sp. MPI-PUGE-AT-0066]|nr:nucleoside phosphatase family-domain-containing protein [Auriculariales sp. MPI-PUGE-AT-0066]
MPPPNIVDPWLASRRFGIVIDAGSSGSRLQIYSWKDARIVNWHHATEVANTLPRVEKGVEHGEDWVKKVEPGISTYANNPEGVVEHLRPLLQRANDIVIPSLQPETPLFLLATAGMRLLPPDQQTALIAATCKFLHFHSVFRIDEPSELGPCGASVRIISGEEEGLFGWLAVNYLMDGFNDTTDKDRTTYGFLDMGGASTQIAFEPKPEDRKTGKGLVNVTLRFLGGTEIHHKVFVTTWLGYGTNQARERYVGHLINKFEHTRRPGGDDVVHDPCLPKSLTLTETPVHDEDAEAHARKQHTLVGTGSFTDCLAEMAPMLNKSTPCNQPPCLFNGVHVPPIDFEASHFIGVSEYWYSSENIFGLGGSYDFVQYERAASSFCGDDWKTVLAKHDKQLDAAHVGGDGEVLKNGTVVEVGKWDKPVARQRLEMQCFKAAWLVNVLHGGIGLPRITDPGGNRSTEGEHVADNAEKLGLGKDKPRFQTMDTIGDVAISWTLGKMVLEASKEVPPRDKQQPSVPDPHEVKEHLPSPADTTPAKPINGYTWDYFDFDDLEDRLTEKLPHSLKPERLGFSIVTLLFWVCALVLLFIVASKLRLRFRWCQRRLRRLSIKRDDREALDSYAEDGMGGSIMQPSTPTISRPASPVNYSSRRWWSLLAFAIRRVFGRSQGAYAGKSFSVPRTSYQPPRTPGYMTPVNGDREPIISPGVAQFVFAAPADGDVPSTPSNPLYALASSRNTSQVNLHATLTPRNFGTLSRGGSGVATPVPRVHEY